MQETHNNYFWLKIGSTTFCQVKTSKHECRNITATYILALDNLPVFTDEGSCYVFLTQNNCCKFLASYNVIIQRVIQSDRKIFSKTGQIVFRTSQNR